MARQSLDGVLQHLRNLATVQTCREMSDRELLERFVAADDEAAFTVLVERHGPMVLGVCRRALANFHDAEDACQATFLVLARKASSVRKKTSLSSWLHGVACRVALKLKRDHARRQSRERRVHLQVQEDPAAEVSWREVQTILDEVLEQLPERYRAPVILCYLECMTREEAAQQLGLSPGSLHGRLERGRELLRQRLSKRGLTLAAVLSAAALGEGVAQAALAPTFVVSSTRAALLLAAGEPLSESAVAGHVLALTQEVLKTMLLAKLKLGTAALLCAGLFVVLLGGSFTSRSIAQDVEPKAVLAAPDQKSAEAKTESDAEFIRRISKDLRGSDPTPAEIHFFVASKDPGRRQKLIDLFIQERQSKQRAEALKRRPDRDGLIDPDRLIDLDGDGWPDILEAVKLRERIERERRELLIQKAKQAEKRQVPEPPNDLNGVIEKIDPKDPALVTISLGSDAGLVKDHTLDVFRLKPSPMYLGKLCIVYLSPHKAVARRVNKLPADHPALKVGDNVTSPLIAPAEKNK